MQLLMRVAANSPTVLRNMSTDTHVRANARLCIGFTINPDSTRRWRMWRASLVVTRRIAPHEKILVPYSNDYVYPVSSAVRRLPSPAVGPSPTEVVDLISSDSSVTHSAYGVIDLCSTLSAESDLESTLSARRTTF